MRVWLVQITEPLPPPLDGSRLMRSGLLAHALVARGHDVHWWASTFLHSERKVIFGEDRDLTLDTGIHLHLIHAPPYVNHISYRRIRHHSVFAERLRRRVRQEGIPEVIHCSFPTIEVCDVITEFGEDLGVPVVVDVRDMWPDIFVGSAGPWLKPMAWFYGRWMTPRVKRIFSRASAVIGTTPGMVGWALEKADRPMELLDRSFPHGYPRPESPDLLEKDGSCLWDGLGMRKEDPVFRICFFGTVGVRNLEAMEKVIECARRLRSRASNVQFIFCGAGVGMQHLKKSAAGLDNVLFPGWVSASQIWSLMVRCQVGLIPYKATKDFQVSIPNKGIEYLAGALPVLVSWKGYFYDVLRKNGCGRRYDTVLDLENLLIDLMSNPVELKEMSQRAVALFDKEFSAEMVYSEMAQHLEMVSGGFDGKLRGARKDTPALP